jgi:hypothetical protein
MTSRDDFGSPLITTLQKALKEALGQIEWGGSQLPEVEQLALASTLRATYNRFMKARGKRDRAFPKHYIHADPQQRVSHLYIADREDPYGD